jgi:MoxR-like ATPase
VSYILKVAEATRRNEELTIGISPRGSLAMMQAARAAALLDGRDYVVPDDVAELAPGVCCHRLVSKSLGGGSAAAAETIFHQILETIPVPL